MALTTLNDVFVDQIEDLYSAETQLITALPKMAAAASDVKLREAIENHLGETRGHVDRLAQIKDELAINATQKCQGMAGLVAEGEAILGEPGSGPAKDAAIVGAAQRVEHYEIAAYGTARALADELGLDEAKKLLKETLDEESAADALLNKIATGGFLQSGINAEANPDAEATFVDRHVDTSVPLGDTREVHDEISPHDIPLDNPGRDEAE
jgi:ferritin-like metal-binding protein YciE